MKVLICGSRYTNRSDASIKKVQQSIHKRLTQLPSSTIITGGAKGVDTWAHDIALELNFDTIVIFPKWTEDGNFNPSAGFERNIKMLEMKPDLVIAFWDGSSKGTVHTVSEAEKRNIRVELVTIP